MHKLGLVVHAYNSSTWEMEEGGSEIHILFLFKARSCYLWYVPGPKDFPKFWWLGKSQYSSGTCEVGSPLPKGAIFFLSLAEEVNSYLSCPLAYQSTCWPSTLRDTRLPQYHKYCYRDHDGILALLTSSLP